MKKKMISALLGLAIATWPLQQARANPVIIIIVVAACLGGGTCVVVKSAQPKYWCLCDEDEVPPRYWIAAATSREIALNGWKAQGPFPSVAAASPCPASLSTNELVSPFINPFGIYPAMLYLEESTNLINWTVIQSQFEDMENFAFDPISVGDKPLCYYRVRAEIF